MFSLKGNEEALKRFVRSVGAGEFLFHQNDLGNTMFIIMGGTIELLDKRGHEYVIVGTMGQGQVLGEKAILQETPYRRTYSVRAKVETTLLEFETKNIKIIAAIIPDFTLRILQTAAKRLDKANEMIELLRPMDSAQRFIKCIQFIFRQNGVQSAGGVEAPISLDDIYQITSINRPLITQYLARLTTNKVLVKTKAGFVLPNEHALTDSIADLQEHRDRAAA